MDQDKIEYFIAKYRAAEAEELHDLCSRESSLADEAQAALRLVAAERAISLTHVQQDASPLELERGTAREVEERSYSPARAELIRIRKMWFLWSLPLAFMAGFVYGGAAELAKGTFMVRPVALLGLFAFVWPLYCLYKMSRAVDSKRSVAWGMVAVQVLPIIGWIAALSLVLKANRICKAVARSASSGEAVLPRGGGE